jgi:glycosyltransferase involved in cell wall biosynthesis
MSATAEMSSLNVKPRSLEPRLQAPRLSEVGVVGLVPEAWETVWMPRHQVLHRLARWFRVVWLDPAREWREAIRGRSDAAVRSAAPIAEMPGFEVRAAEPWLPVFHRPKALGTWMAKLRLLRAQTDLRRAGCRRIVRYIWRPEFDYALDAGARGFCVYHIDDEYSFSPTEAPLSERERRLIAGADRVVIHSPALLDKKGKINPRTSFIPNGVDFQAFATPKPEPPDLARVPHPRIGYAGVVKSQLDLALLVELSRRHPQWSFPMVGPLGFKVCEDPHYQALAAQRNVFLLGHKSVDELPAYVQHFDVCLMCYAVNEYTKYIFPLKLHEYLASGRPVVSVPIRSVLDFAEVVTLATGADEWSRAIAAALEPAASCPERAAARQSVASAYDWNTLVARIAGLICDGLGPEYQARWAEVSRDEGRP